MGDKSVCESGGRERLVSRQGLFVGFSLLHFTRGISGATVAKEKCNCSVIKISSSSEQISPSSLPLNKQGILCFYEALARVLLLYVVPG